MPPYTRHGPHRWSVSAAVPGHTQVLALVRSAGRVAGAAPEVAVVGSGWDQAAVRLSVPLGQAEVQQQPGRSLHGCPRRRAAHAPSRSWAAHELCLGSALLRGAHMTKFEGLMSLWTQPASCSAWIAQRACSPAQLGAESPLKAASGTLPGGHQTARQRPCTCVAHGAGGAR